MLETAHKKTVIKDKKAPLYILTIVQFPFIVIYNALSYRQALKKQTVFSSFIHKNMLAVLVRVW